MQAQPDYLNVPRRALDVEDYIDILRRHWMWIAGPGLAGLVASVVVAFLWPDTFTSNAVLRITPSQVSDASCPPTSTYTCRTACPPCCGHHEPVQADRHDQEVQPVSVRSGQEVD
jgi:hypothetical protein